MHFDDSDDTADIQRENARLLLEESFQILQRFPDPRQAFLELTRVLEHQFSIHKAMLAVREDRAARFIAVATWDKGRCRRNLSLRLPTDRTLFAAVIEHGQMFAENFAELFDGSVIERQLLLDDDTQSFMLRPLKHEGTVVGLLGFGSANPDAFLLFEEGLFDRVMERLAETIAAHEPARSSS